eukprot:3038973-Pyramimonas_sp.AAC.1
MAALVSRCAPCDRSLDQVRAESAEQELKNCRCPSSDTKYGAIRYRKAIADQWDPDVFLALSPVETVEI